MTPRTPHSGGTCPPRPPSGGNLPPRPPGEGQGPPSGSCVRRRNSMSGNLAELVGMDVPTRLLIGGEWTGGRRGGTPPGSAPPTPDTPARVGDRGRHGARHA